MTRTGVLARITAERLVAHLEPSAAKSAALLPCYNLGRSSRQWMPCGLRSWRNTKEWAMANVDMKILTALEKEMSNAEIVTATGIDRADVGPALTRLRAAGLVISRGRTNKRTHMRLAMAIEKLFEEIELHDLRLIQLERRPAKSK
jgi:hypothetical protein